MAIKKQYLKSKPVCKVTFTVPAKKAKKVAVVGDFNKWNPKTGQLKKLKNGSFKGVVDLKKGNRYEFKYLVDDTFVNEEQADGFVFNEFAGSENGILDL